MAPVHSLPTETLGEIFASLPFWAVIYVSHVCHRWRDTAKQHYRLWGTLSLTTSATQHQEVLKDLLARSKNCSMHLKLVFYAPPTDYSEFRRLLTEVLRPHLSRCAKLCIQAHPAGWQTILQGFEGEEYPRLQELEITDWRTWMEVSVGLTQHVFAPALAVLPPPPAAMPAGVPPNWVLAFVPPTSHFVFPLPLDHMVERITVHGMSVADTYFTNLRQLTLDSEFPSMVTSDGKLNSWLLNAAPILCIQHIDVPSIDFLQDDKLHPSSPIVAMVLSDLIATPRVIPHDLGNDEYDCYGFFYALHTPLIRCLIIDRWDLAGRLWYDFIGALPIDRPKFPCLTNLGLNGMHLDGFTYRELVLFLRSMPIVHEIVFCQCWPGTGEVLMEVLELDPSLCLNLRRILVDGALIRRNDPLPFRLC